MLKFFHSFFDKKVLFPPVEHNPVNTDELDASLRLLQDTTAGVSAAAIDAAEVLRRELRESQYRFYQTVDALDDVIIIKDNKGRWKMMNRKAQDVFQCFHREFIDRTDSEIAEIRPDLMEVLEACTKSDQVAWDNKEPHRTLESVVVKGDRLYFDVVKTPVLYEDGTPKEIIIVGRDVTALRDRNKRNKACFTALNSASDAIVIVDRSRRIYFCNDKFLEINDLEDYHDAVGQEFDERWSCGCQNSMDQMWSTVCRNLAWSDSCDCSTISMLPVMNCAPEPLYYIYTVRKTGEHK